MKVTLEQIERMKQARGQLGFDYGARMGGGRAPRPVARGGAGAGAGIAPLPRGRPSKATLAQHQFQQEPLPYRQAGAARAGRYPAPSQQRARRAGGATAPLTAGPIAAALPAPSPAQDQKSDIVAFVALRDSKFQVPHPGQDVLSVPGLVRAAKNQGLKVAGRAENLGALTKTTTLAIVPDAAFNLHGRDAVISAIRDEAPNARVMPLGQFVRALDESTEQVKQVRLGGASDYEDVPMTDGAHFLADAAGPRKRVQLLHKIRAHAQAEAAQQQPRQGGRGFGHVDEEYDHEFGASARAFAHPTRQGGAFSDYEDDEFVGGSAHADFGFENEQRFGGASFEDDELDYVGGAGDTEYDEQDLYGGMNGQVEYDAYAAGGEFDDNFDELPPMATGGAVRRRRRPVKAVVKKAVKKAKTSIIKKRKRTVKAVKKVVDNALNKLTKASPKKPSPKKPSPKKPKVKVTTKKKKMVVKVTMPKTGGAARKRSSPKSKSRRGKSKSKSRTSAEFKRRSAAAKKAARTRKMNAKRRGGEAPALTGGARRRYKSKSKTSKSKKTTKSKRSKSTKKSKKSSRVGARRR